MGTTSLGGRRHGVGHILGPDGPYEAAQFIGDGDRRLVMAAAVPHRERPVMEPAQRLLGGPLSGGADKDGARPMISRRRWRTTEELTASCHAPPPSLPISAPRLDGIHERWTSRARLYVVALGRRAMCRTLR